MSRQLHQRLVDRARKRELERGRRGLRQRPPVWRFPHGIEREYIAELRRAVRDINKYINDHVVSELSDLIKQAEKSRDDSATTRLDQTWPQRADELIAAAQVFGRRRVSQIDPRIYGKKVSLYNKRERNRIIRSVLGVDVIAAEPWLADMMTSWVNENRKLIRTIPQRELDDIEGIVQRGLRSGDNISNIRDDIRKRYNNSEYRARLIARDQIAKLNGQITEQRQTQLGITHAIWVTSGDERVRDSHALLDGTRFSWEEGAGPDGIFPGQEINCRCISAPDLSGLLDELADDPDVLAARRERGLELIGFSPDEIARGARDE